MKLSPSSALRSLRGMSAATAVAFTLAAPAGMSAQQVNFNDLGYGPSCQWGGGPQIANGYAGFNWGGFSTLDIHNLSEVCGRSTNTGYASLSSANVGNVIGLGAGTAYLSRGTAFTLTSFVAGAGWIDHTKLTLDFYLGGVLKSSSLLDLGVFQTGASPFSSGLYNGATDFIRFTPDYSGANASDTFNSLAESCYGVAAPCVPTTYKTFFIDNLQFVSAAAVVTPEPASVAMMGAGLLLSGLVFRRRRRG